MVQQENVFLKKRGIIQVSLSIFWRSFPADGIYQAIKEIAQI